MNALQYAILRTELKPDEDGYPELMKWKKEVTARVRKEEELTDAEKDQGRRTSPKN